MTREYEISTYDFPDLTVNLWVTFNQSKQDYNWRIESIYDNDGARFIELETLPSEIREEILSEISHKFKNDTELDADYNEMLKDDNEDWELRDFRINKV